MRRKKATKTTAGQLKSPTARLDLTARTRPYFIKVAPSVWLGYRKPLSGPGSWVARRAGQREQTLWTADDNGLKADNDKVLSFWQAQKTVQDLSGYTSSLALTDAGGVVTTLDEALTAYEPTLRNRGANVYNAKRPRHHLSETLLTKPLSLLAREELEGWRDGMAVSLAPSTVNRIAHCVRAALTLADPTRVHIWRAGLKVLPDANVSDNTVIEDEATAQQWVAQSYAHDHALGLLTHTVAETGARPGQCVRLRVRDLILTDPATPRLMMPMSGKGGTRYPGRRKLDRYSVSISPALAALLKTAAKGRPSKSPLLLKADGEPWSESDPATEYRRGVRAVVETIGLDADEYGLYAFRHTRITNMLRNGIHTAIVAKAHDTSEAMIRKHYAADILDFTDEMTRKTLPDLGPVQPAASNVVAITAAVSKRA